MRERADVSDSVITIGGDVTTHPRSDGATAPTCPTPPGRPFAVARDRARLSGGVNTSTRPSNVLRTGCAWRHLLPTTSLWLDKGYTGATVAKAAQRAGISVDIVSGPKPASGFRVQPRRRVVERTNGWINHTSTATTKSPPPHTKASFILSQIALLLRRLDRSQLFDTL